MKRHKGLYLMIALALTALLAGCWGSSKDTSLEVGVSPTPARVGSEQCTNTCHAVTVDISGNPIAATWASSEHTLDGGVQCEDCHGGGGNHWGVGPIPYPNPSYQTCAVLACHGTMTPSTLGFSGTRHANGNQIPDGSFSQISTPVSTGRHIEECSVCHNPNQRFEFDSQGNLVKPTPTALPNPSVTCGSCHYGHNPMNVSAIPQRTEEYRYPVFRNYLVDNAAGAQTFDNTSGTQINLTDLNLLFQPNGAVRPNGTVDNTFVVGTNNEIHPDRLCAACHARGNFKFSGGETHQDDIWTQWTESGHGDRNAAAFAEFSANPPAYTDVNGDPYPNGSHRSSYPIDMAISAFTTAGPADTTHNAGNNNFACFKCHHGLGSIAYQDNVEGIVGGDAHVLFGDVTVTCLTCHNPHTDVAGNTKNTRKPLVMTKYSSTQVTFSGNVFLDNTSVPGATGNATICVFCHQGRESGFTLFKRRIAAGTTITGSFLNEHYLGTGAMLWGRNAYEYGGKQYGQVDAHQQTNCNGCHMAAHSTREDIGGHTWRIFSEVDNVVNNVSCNVAACHNGRVPATKAGLDAFRDTVYDPTNDYDGDGVVEGIPVEVTGLEDHLIGLLDNNGITYSDTTYPYFFFTGTTTAYTAWTRPTLKAAFNLQYAIKGLPSAGAPNTQIGKPNPSAATHNYRYNIQILIDSYADLYAATASPNPSLPLPSAHFRPAGTRPATNYANPGSATYDTNQ